MRNLVLIILAVSLNTTLFSANTDLQNKYLQAKQYQERNKFEPILEELATTYVDSMYGQLALLELAKLNLLDRNYESAISFLKKIHLPQISEKQFWLAKAYLKNEQFQLAIISAQIYIADGANSGNIEEAYFIMAEAFQKQQNYRQALKTLEELKNSQHINNNIPLLHYKMGICCELLADYNSALIYYKKLKQEFPYHQYSYLAEEQVYKLKSDKKINVDLTNFSSYRLVDPNHKPVQNTQIESNLYLQAGAFKSKTNAKKIGNKIKSIGYDFSIFTKIKNKNKLYVVVVGPFMNENKMSTARQKLEKNGVNSFVVKNYN